VPRPPARITACAAGLVFSAIADHLNGQSRLVWRFCLSESLDPQEGKAERIVA